MILTAALMIVLGQDPLPGSGLGLEEARAEARFIVVAEVGKTSDRVRIHPAGVSFCMWTELKPSAVLKGEVTGEELNRHPLAMYAKGAERLPGTGDELIFFLADAGWDFVNITKILPKTEANLAAIRSKTPPLARSEPGESGQDLHPIGGSTGGIGGGIGVGGVGATTGLGSGGIGGGFSSHELRGGFLTVPEPERPPYQGTKIVPNSVATGEALKLQQEFAAAMSRADPVPEGRRAHFAWLDKDEHVRRYRVARVGWYGGILSADPRPGGGWIVRIVIRPWLHPFGGSLSDCVEETYDYVGGRLHLTRSDAAVAKPNLQKFRSVFF